MRPPKSRESLFCCQNCDNVVFPSGKLSVMDLHPTQNSAETHHKKVVRLHFNWLWVNTIEQKVLLGSRILCQGQFRPITHRTYKGAKPVCFCSVMVKKKKKKPYDE